MGSGRDAFVLPVSGGPAQRLTYGDGALVRGWASDTEVLFTTRGYSDLPDEQLVAIDIKSTSFSQVWTALVFLIVPERGRAVQVVHLYNKELYFTAESRT